MVGHLGAELLKAALCTALLLFPILVAWLPRYKTLPARARFALLTLLLTLATAAYILHLKGDLHLWTMPWLVHVIGSEGIFQFNWDMLGARPVTIPIWLQAVISIIVIESLALFCLEVSALRSRQPEQDEERLISYLLGPYTLAHICLLLPRGATVFIYDRYLLGLLPVTIVLILTLLQRSGLRITRAAYAVLATFAVYGVLATHDLFALNRARVAAVEEVRASGVSAGMIQAGFEYDGWTEVSLAGHINEKRIEAPAGAYVHDSRYLERRQPCRLGFDEYTPALNRAYLVTLAQTPCGVQSAFAAVEFRGWLPPFRRWVYIREVPQLPAR
jgi:hypothetical protein